MIPNRLDASDWDLLMEVVSKRQPDSLHEFRTPDDITADEAKARRNLLGDELVDTGVDARTGEHNLRGMAIESVISHLPWW